MKRAFIAIILCAVSLSMGCQSNLGSGCAGGKCGLLGGGCQDGAQSIAAHRMLEMARILEARGSTAQALGVRRAQLGVDGSE